MFEFVDQTVLDELERCPRGMHEEAVRRIIYQVLRGTEFCHNNGVSDALCHFAIDNPEKVIVSILCLLLGN